MEQGDPVGIGQRVIHPDFTFISDVITFAPFYQIWWVGE
jgi:hypothetical protein